MKEVKIKKDFWFVLVYVLLLVTTPWFLALIRQWHSIPKVNFSLAITGYTATLSRYFHNFSGKFLFFEGDWFLESKAMASQGVLPLVGAFLLVLGLVFLVQAKRDFWDNLMLSFLFLAPLPSVAFSQNPLTITSSLMIFPLAYISTVGIVSVWKKSKIWLLPLGFFYFLSLIRFYDLFFLH